MLKKRHLIRQKVFCSFHFLEVYIFSFVLGEYAAVYLVFGAAVFYHVASRSAVACVRAAPESATRSAVSESAFGIVAEWVVAVPLFVEIVELLFHFVYLFEYHKEFYCTPYSPVDEEEEYDV